MTDMTDWMRCSPDLPRYIRDLYNRMFNVEERSEYEHARLETGLDLMRSELAALRAERDALRQDAKTIAARMESDHIISGSIGPLFDVGWAEACKAWAPKVAALAQGEKGE
jgi:hypothetical protein